MSADQKAQNQTTADRSVARGCLASLQHNIKAMQETKASPSFVQVLVSFQMAADAIERLLGDQNA